LTPAWDLTGSMLGTTSFNSPFPTTSPLLPPPHLSLSPAGIVSPNIPVAVQRPPMHHCRAPHRSRSAPAHSHRQPPQSSCPSHHCRAPHPSRSAPTHSHRQPPQSSCPSHQRRAPHPSRSAPTHSHRSPPHSSCHLHYRCALTLNITQTLLQSHRLHRVLHRLGMTHRLHRVLHRLGMTHRLHRVLTLLGMTHHLHRVPLSPVALFTWCLPPRELQ
jgi:hypothetical protein